MNRSFLKTGLAIFLLGVTFVSIAFANSSADNEVREIKKLYATINTMTLSSSTVSVHGLSTEGGIITVYRDANGYVRKLALNLFGEMGRSTSEYFLESEQPRFIFEKEEHYNQHIIEPGDIKVVRTEENRRYVANGKLIRWIETGGKRVASDDQAFLDKQREIFATFKVLKVALSAASTPSTLLEQWEKCMEAVTSGPEAGQIEQEAGLIGLGEYALERCGVRPTAPRADGQRALLVDDCDRLYDMAATAECAPAGGALADNEYLKLLDPTVFNEDAFWAACQQVQAGTLSRSAFGKQLCGE